MRNAIGMTLGAMSTGLGVIVSFIINLLTSTSTRNSSTTGITDGVLVTYAANTPSFNEGALQNYGAGTNLVFPSEDLSDVLWAKDGSTVSGTLFTAPDGELTANNLIESVTNAVHNFGKTVVTFVNGNSYTFSVFAKADTRSWFSINPQAGAFPGTGVERNAYFDVGNGVLGSIGASFSDAGIDALGNGWYRCWATISATASSDNPVLYNMASADLTPVYLGDGSGIFFWGIQIEVGSVPTPYQPTTTAAVTFNADVTTDSVPSFVAQDGDFAFKFKGTPKQTAQALKALFSFDSDATNYTEIQLNAANITANSVLLGVSNGAAVGLYTHTVNVKFETNVYYVAATKTLGIRSDDVSGDILLVLFAEDILTSHPVITALLSTGNRNSLNQAACNIDNDGVPVFYANKEAAGW